MTEYAICFDFPEEDDPWFAGQISGEFGLVAHLADAKTWVSETNAEQALENAYGGEARTYGAVVEVGEK